MSSLDTITIDFTPESLTALNAALALVMFGVALHIKPDEIRSLRERPRATAVGLASQWILLPAITLLLIVVVRPHPGLALGMLLVSACPGGNVSNFLVQLARGNAALSVGLTTISSLLAVVLTPTLFRTLAPLVTSAAELPALEVELADILRTLAWVVAAPLILGLALAHRAPAVVRRIGRPIRALSAVVLVAFIVIALKKNFGVFTEHIGAIFILVAVQNALALGGGWLVARAARLPEEDRRAIAFETGLQNSGLGLVLIFTFFGGNGAMALVAGWWGVWHILSGATLAYFAHQRPPKATALRERITDESRS